MIARPRMMGVDVPRCTLSAQVCLPRRRELRDDVDVNQCDGFEIIPHELDLIRYSSSLIVPSASRKKTTAYLAILCEDAVTGIFTHSWDLLHMVLPRGFVVHEQTNNEGVVMLGEAKRA